MTTTNINLTVEICSEDGIEELPLKTGGPKKIQAVLTMLLTVVTLVLFGGCSSVPALGPDPAQYNFNTEYPAVGSGWPRHSNL